MRRIVTTREVILRETVEEILDEIDTPIQPVAIKGQSRLISSAGIVSMATSELNSVSPPTLAFVRHNAQRGYR
jgi:hypothetical protein